MPKACLEPPVIKKDEPCPHPDRKLISYIKARSSSGFFWAMISTFRCDWCKSTFSIEDPL